jgi:hypothetical protein
MLAAMRMLVVVLACGCSESGQSPDTCFTDVYLDGEVTTMAMRQVTATVDVPLELCLELDAGATTDPLTLRAQIIGGVEVTFRRLTGGELASGIDTASVELPPGTSMFALLELAIEPPSISITTQVSVELFQTR